MRNGTKSLLVNLKGGEFLIGMDLFRSLGFEMIIIPFNWSTEGTLDTDDEKETITGEELPSHQLLTRMKRHYPKQSQHTYQCNLQNFPIQNSLLTIGNPVSVNTKYQRDTKILINKYNYDLNQESK